MRRWFEESVGRLDAHWAAYALPILAFLLVTNHLTFPFIEHDDWDWLINWHQITGYASPWSTTLSDGRWIGFLWSAFSRYMSPEIANALFISLYAGFCVAFQVLISSRRFSALASLAIFFAPAAMMWSAWPASNTPAIGIGFMGACALIAATTIRRMLIVLAISVFLAVMAYPSIAAVLLLGAIIALPTHNPRNVVLTLVTYLSAYFLAVIAISTLNLVFHNHFGVVIAGWRGASPPHSFADLIANLNKNLIFWQQIRFFTGFGLAVGVIAGAIALAVRRTRDQAACVLITVFFLLGKDTTMAMILGVTIPYRSAFWLWPALCGGAILLTGCDLLLPRVIGIAALGALLVQGSIFWASAIQRNVTIVKAESVLALELEFQMAATGTSRVIYTGDPRTVSAFRPLSSPKALELAVWKRYGVRLSPCSPTECAAIASGQIVPGAVVWRFSDLKP